VDVHAHCAIPKAFDLLTQQVNPAGLSLEGQAYGDRISRMDAQGIDIAVLSINPTWYGADRDLVTQVIDIQNEALAEFCGAHSDRFAAFSSVALQFPDLAAEQLERGMKKLGLRGAAIGGSVQGQELSDPKFHPFWAKAEELKALIFLHPQATAGEFGNRLQGNGVLNISLWNPIETTVALTHLIFEGTLDRFPGLKICAAHGGGYLPSYIGRSDHVCQTFPGQCKPGVPAKRPSAYLRQLYFDSLVFTPEGLRHLIAEAGVSQIMMGTDYPYPWVTGPVEHILQTPGLIQSDREAMLGGTASALLNLTSRRR
jgi:aminocarboxymuconate-semialdehyde decarboxylase